MAPKRMQTFHTTASLKDLEAADQGHFVHPVMSPYSSRRRFLPSLTNALLATAMFRCWHLILLFSGWAAGVVLICKYVHDISFQSTLLNVFGTILGFVISYRTSSSFERYNEGRKLWSTIIFSTRTYARAVWFHVPDYFEEAGQPESETRARLLIEKKTVINLLQAFAVSIKHYLRGEDGINYVDLYHLVKFLPSYNLPASVPSPLPSPGPIVGSPGSPPSPPDVPGLAFALRASASAPHLPATATASGAPLGQIRTRVSSRSPQPALPGISDVATSKVSIVEPQPQPQHPFAPITVAPASPTRSPLRERFSPLLPTHTSQSVGLRPLKTSFGPMEDPQLLPASNPPRWHMFDIFPFSLFVRHLTKKGVELKGKRAARIRARIKTKASHNIPLEISFYLSSYIAALQQRKSIDVATTNLLLNSLNTLVDSLTGLERILTTPIPFSYNVHLWTVAMLYVGTLPFQIVKTMNWLTIPGTAIASFFFFGFLSLGAEIENPFGYDKNDLNLCVPLALSTHFFFFAVTLTVTLTLAQRSFHEHAHRGRA
ncbi:UPF0187-domain-containing protein [Auriculariales sp. MPI-PUGE-AT-0066]|nr:UPF0187-domain-containing protein [Auriculariales sp. MPI-PUGE-AT-0066]